ncbi:MAG: tetratricopeptide repeat protein [Planctomycetota bacterium]|nr:MAG: tetratricopeptide repeat protein [Planctomycetota bacterium]
MPSARDKFLIDLLVENGIMTGSAGEAALIKKQSLDDEGRKINLISLLVREGYISQSDVPRVNELVLDSAGKSEAGAIEDQPDEDLPVAIPVDGDVPELRLGSSPDAPSDEVLESIPMAIPVKRPPLRRQTILLGVILGVIVVLVFILISSIADDGGPQTQTQIPKPPTPAQNTVRPDQVREFLAVQLAFLYRDPGPASEATRLEAKAREKGPFADAYLLLSAEALRLAGNANDAYKRVTEVPGNFPAPAYRNLITARIAHDSGDYAAAIKAATRALEVDPAMTPARLIRGKSYFRGGRFDSALEDLNAVIKAEPRNGKARGVRGLLYAAAGKLRAVDDLEFALSTNKQPDPELAIVKGALALEAGESGEAKNSFIFAGILAFKQAEPLALIALAEVMDNQHFAAQHNINSARALDNRSLLADIAEGLLFEKLGNFPQACELLTKGMENLDNEAFALAFKWPDRPLPPPDAPPALHPVPLMPGLRSKLYLTRAKCLISLGKFKKAEADLAQLTESFQGEPARPECYKGLIAESKEDYAAAEKAFSAGAGSALSQKWQVRCLTGRARARLKLGKRDAAISDLEKSVRIGVEHKEAAWLLAAENYKAGDYSKAIMAATEVLGLDSGHARAWLLRGRAYLAQNRLKRAENDFTKALQIDPESDGAYAARGKTLSLAAKNDRGIQKALKDYANAVRLKPRNLEYRIAKAEHERKLGEYKAAMDELGAAIRIAPERLDIIFLRAQIALEAKKYDEALENFSTAAEASHRPGAAWLEIGKIHENAGELEKARQAYESAGKSLSDAPKRLPFYLARISFKEKKFSEAREALTPAFLERENFADAWALSGEIDLRLNSPHNALRELNRALKIERLNARFYYLRGIAYYRMRKFKNALDDFLMARGFNPELKNLEPYIDAARDAVKAEEKKKKNK